MAQYEFMMILDPSIGEEEINNNVTEIEKALTDAGAKVENKDVWGDKKLAYKIKGSDRGYYILWTLELDGTQIKSLNSLFNLNGNIWRYMFVNLEA
ncbi:30S ribosomal protein S6 [Candidatus Gracilibacteria bacterium]|nr:30S ribosomal protein S6 [Candidatus Gracilibacteria bacterium]